AAAASRRSPGSEGAGPTDRRARAAASLAARKPDSPGARLAASATAARSEPDHNVPGRPPSSGVSVPTRNGSAPASGATAASPPPCAWATPAAANAAAAASAALTRSAREVDIDLDLGLLGRRRGHVRLPDQIEEPARAEQG